jgi:hypothetical protein
MNWKKGLVFSFAALTLLGCADIQGSLEDSGDRDASSYLGLGTAKGLEIYCWRENETWRAGLMSGTNRTKTPAEVDGLPGLSLSKMNAVLKTYASTPELFATPIMVSRPSKDSEILAHTTPSEIAPYLDDQLGLSSRGVLASLAKGESRKLSIDKDSAIHLKHSLAAAYPAGSWIELAAYPLMDADLAFYLNGVLISKGYQIGSEKAWLYHFEMPDQDSVLSFRAISSM